MTIEDALGTATADMRAKGFVAGQVSDHRLCSLAAADEPDRQRQRALLDLSAAIPMAEAFAATGATLERLATTPDFHAGRPVPVGVVAAVRGAVLPHLVGNDIGCGMRLMVLEGIGADEIDEADSLDRHLRHVLFQGGRDLALTGRMRRALLEEGLYGLLESVRVCRPPGLVSRLDLDEAAAELDRTCDLGTLAAGGLDPDFADFAPLDDEFRRDAILGSLGGGNHFLEIGCVDHVADGGFARLAGLRLGSVTLCVHSGSLDFGHRIGGSARDKLAVRRGKGLDHRILPLEDPLAARYLRGLANAGNAAFGNRLFLGLAAAMAISRALGREVRPRLVYDAPHNMAWSQDDVVIHRKGACPARAGEALGASPYRQYGEPVVLPGSMGDATWLLAGQGAAETVSSSAHGAGRRLSRSQARREPDAASHLAKLRVVGPLDLADPALRGRRDILDEARGRLAEEAPSAYRPIEHVAEPMVAAGVVRPVARIRPLLSAKG